MSGKTLNTSESRVEALKIQSSAQGVTIPVVYGVSRLAGNLLWYANFQSTPNTTETSSGKGGVKTTSTAYTYSASLMMGLCHGPISGIPRIWRGKQLYEGGIESTQLDTANESFTVPGSGPMTYALDEGATYTRTTLVYINDYPGAEGGTVMYVMQPEADFVVEVGVLRVLSEYLRGYVVHVEYQYTTGTISTSALDSLGLTLKTGELFQAPWSALASYSPQDLGYSGIALLAGEDYDLGTGAQVENHTVEVVGPFAYHLGTDAPDVDPALVLRDLLANGRYGAAFPAASVGDWSQWSDWCVASNLLVSPAITEQSKAAEVVRKMAELTGTAPVWSGGRLKMVPYGDAEITGNGRTFEPDATAVYELDDESFTAPLTCEIKGQSERYNHWRIEFMDRSNQYNKSIVEAKDDSDIALHGLRSAPVVQAHWVCDANTARQVAQTLMQRSLHVINTYTGTLPWHLALLEPMDLCLLTDAGLGLSQTPVRVVEIVESEDGDLEITFEDYPGVASAVRYPAPGGQGYAPNYNEDPGDVEPPMFFEAPAALASGTTGLEVYIAVTGLDPDWGGCEVWASLDDASYSRVGVQTGGSRYGTAQDAAGDEDLKLDFGGTNGSTSVVDSSANADNKSAPTGISISTNYAVAGGSSLRIAKLGSAGISYGSGNRYARTHGQACTYEFWFRSESPRYNGTEAPTLFYTHTGSGQQLIRIAQYTHVNQVSLRWGTGDPSTNHGYSPLANGWVHVAVVIDESGGGVFYVNGASVKTFTASTWSPGGVVVGGHGSDTGSSTVLNCYIDNVRVSMNEAKWSATFDPLDFIGGSTGGDIDVTLLQGTLLSASAEEAETLTTLCYVDTGPGEYFAYETAALTSALHYTLGGLVRSAYGTTAEAVPADTGFARVDSLVFKSGGLDLSNIGKTYYVKFPSFNKYGRALQSLADIPAYQYTITGDMLSLPGVTTGARDIRLIASALAFSVSVSGSATPSSITLTIERYGGITEAVVWTIAAGTVTLGGSGDTRTLTAADMSTDSVRIRATVTTAAQTFVREVTIAKYGATADPGSPGAPAIAAILSTYAVAFTADSFGVVDSGQSYPVTATVLRGGVDDTANWTFTRASSHASITTSISGAVVTITGTGVDAGYVDITAARSGYASRVMRVAVSKAKRGATAIAATLSTYAVTFAADSAGLIDAGQSYVVTAQVMRGGADDTANWTFARTSSDASITTSISGAALTINGMGTGVDSGYVDITASRTWYADQGPMRVNVGKTKRPPMSTIGPYYATGVATGGATAVARVEFRRNGEVYSFTTIGEGGDTSAKIGDWKLPNSTAVGDGFELRLDRVAGSAVTLSSGVTLGAYIAISATRSIELSGVGSESSALLFSIRPTGGAAVSSGFINLTAISSGGGGGG